MKTHKQIIEENDVALVVNQDDKDKNGFYIRKDSKWDGPYHYDSEEKLKKANILPLNIGNL